MHDNRSVGIFDSGVGGLTVLEQIQKLLPKESIVYLADQANLPYGTKSEEVLRNVSKRAIEFLLSKKVKAVVIACNTATVYAIEYLRSQFDIPIIGTVPVVKTIVKNTKSGKVAVFATPATAKSHYLSDLIRKFAKDKKVYIVGGSNLEKIIEKGRLDNPRIESILNDLLMPLVEEGFDAIALGCTHYPFVRRTIEAKVGARAKVFDSGPAVARRLKEIFIKEGLLGSGRVLSYYTTGDPLKFKSVAQKLLGKKLSRVKKVII